MVTRYEPKTASELRKGSCERAERRDGGIGRGLAELVEKARRELLRQDQGGELERAPNDRHLRELRKSWNGTHTDRLPGGAVMLWNSRSLIARER